MKWWEDGMAWSPCTERESSSAVYLRTWTRGWEVVLSERWIGADECIEGGFGRKQVLWELGDVLPLVLDGQFALGDCREELD